MKTRIEPINPLHLLSILFGLLMYLLLSGLYCILMFYMEINVVAFFEGILFHLIFITYWVGFCKNLFNHVNIDIINKNE